LGYYTIDVFIGNPPQK